MVSGAAPASTRVAGSDDTAKQEQRVERNATAEEEIDDKEHVSNVGI